MSTAAAIYMILSALGFGVTLPAEDIALVERVFFKPPEELPAGVCAITITKYWPDGSQENDDEIWITGGERATTGCRIDFFPTTILHEVGHVYCNHYHKAEQMAAPDPTAAVEECAWRYTSRHLPNQTAQIFIPPDTPVGPVYGGPK